MSDEWVIWWTTEEEAMAISAHFGSPELPLPEMCPEYLRGEFASRLGRSGRGRLWVPDIPGAPTRAVFSDGSGSPLETHCERCAGIVMLAAHVPSLRHLPGIVTSVDLVRYP